MGVVIFFMEIFQRSLSRSVSRRPTFPRLPPPLLPENAWRPSLSTAQLLFNLETFYREILGRDVSPDLDLPQVARNSSPEGIRTLVQLLVGAAVSCGGKADYIQAIMQVDDGLARYFFLFSGFVVIFNRYTRW